MVNHQEVLILHDAPRYALGTGIALWVLALVCIFLWARVGPGVTQKLDRKLGEFLLNEGLRLERAGDIYSARYLYMEALDSEFDHPQNRTEALSRLGNLVLWQDGPEKALPILTTALHAGDYTVWLFPPLCEALFQLRRLSDANVYSEIWYQKALESGDRSLQAHAKLLQGRSLLGLGFQERALDAFRVGEQIVHGGLNAYYAGTVLYDLGKHDEARSYLERYLVDGGGENAAWAKTLLQRIGGQDVGLQ